MAPKGGNTLEELSERQVLLFTAHDLTNRAGLYTLIDVGRAEASHGVLKADWKDSDDRFEYRHVILPKQMLKLIPKSCVTAHL